MAFVVVVAKGHQISIQMLIGWIPWPCGTVSSLDPVALVVAGYSPSSHYFVQTSLPNDAWQLLMLKWDGVEDRTRENQEGGVQVENELNENAAKATFLCCRLEKEGKQAHIAATHQTIPRVT